MNTELPVPYGLGEKKKQNGIKVKAVQFEEIEVGSYVVEYGKKDNEYIFHFYKTGPFSLGFRTRMFLKFVEGFNLRGREGELLQIDWIPEFNSWCVILKDVLGMTPPPTDELVESVVRSIIS